MTDILSDVPEGQFEVVYLGGCTLSGGKPGTSWILRETLDKLADEPQGYEIARRVASAYGAKGTSGRVIGDIYRVQGETDGESPTRMKFGTLQFVGRSSSPLIAPFEADDANARDREYRNKAERAALKEPQFMRDMNETALKLRKMPVRQALSCVDAIAAELRRQVLAR